MKKSTRIFLIILCVLLIALSLIGVIWAIANKISNKAYAEEIDTEEQIVNFNQLFNLYHTDYNNYGVSLSQVNTNGFYISGTPTYNLTFEVATMYFAPYHKYYYFATSTDCYINFSGLGNLVQDQIYYYNSATPLTDTVNIKIQQNTAYSGNYYFNIIDLTEMGIDNYTLQQCKDLFAAPYYRYTTGTPMYLSGVEQYNQGAAAMRESMTITVQSASIADNLDNVVIDSNYGSDSKALIQGYMVWGSSTYTNCTALINLQTNFNQGDYFEFEFYTITGADSLNLPNITDFYDLQIIAVDTSGNIVPLTTIKAQNNANATTKASFYLPFNTDKLYITTPHKYIIGYNNFIINMTTTNLTALSLYSYNDGYRQGKGQGYTAGYNKGISEQNATLGTMEYIGAAFSGIGTILSIELLPGVPFSLFVLLPLMFGLIAFVIKLTKGGA